MIRVEAAQFPGGGMFATGALFDLRGVTYRVVLAVWHGPRQQTVYVVTA